MADLRLVKDLNECLQAVKPRCGCGEELQLVDYKNGLAAIGQDGDTWWFFDQQKYAGTGPKHDVFVSVFGVDVGALFGEEPGRFWGRTGSPMSLKFKRTRVGMCQK